MTPNDLSAWRRDMALSQRDAADALGMYLSSYQRMERGADWETGKPTPINRRTALACAAIRAGLSPEGEPQT